MLSRLQSRPPLRRCALLCPIQSQGLRRDKEGCERWIQVELWVLQDSLKLYNLDAGRPGRCLLDDPNATYAAGTVWPSESAPLGFVPLSPICCR